MRLLYNLFIYLFQFGVSVSALLGNKKAVLWKDGRKDLFLKLEKALPNNREILWFHCASVGEFEQARPLLEQFKKNTNYFILLTFFSPSGYESKKNYSGADYITYLPIDTPAKAKRFVEIVNPKMSFFAKYEFWFNLLKALKDHRNSHYLISGIFRRKQQFFRFYGSWFRKHLANFDYLYLQDQNSKDILNSFGINNCKISGDGRFDRVLEIANEPASFPEIERFKNHEKLVIFGSSWQKENELAFQLKKENPQLKIVLAPHEFHKNEIEHLSKKFGIDSIYYSEKKIGNANNAILVIDQMGLLAKIYRYAEVAVIGGGFGKGIHNILEAAVYGIPVYFGPNYSFFNEAWDLLEKGGAKVFKNEKEFRDLLTEVITDDNLRSKMGDICKEYFTTKSGATSLIYNHLKENKSF